MSLIQVHRQVCFSPYFRTHSQFLADGGLKAWTQVAMAWIVCLTTWGYLNSFGAFQTYYAETLRESQSTISWVGSVQLWVIFVMSAFSGRALDAGLFIPT